MKKIMILISSILMISALCADTAHAGIQKSDSPDYPNGVEINLHSDIDVYGVQFDLSYDTKVLSLKEDDIVSLVNGVDVYSKVTDGSAKVIMFSMAGDKVMIGSSDVSTIISINFDNVNSFNGNSNVKISNLVLAGVNGVAIDRDPNAGFDLNLGLPLKTSLDKNYPNPFNPTTTIPFELSEPGYVTLKVYDMNGSLVKTLSSDYKDAGSYELLWNGLNNDGQQVASGQYILKMSAPNYTNTMQMTFLK